MSTNYENPYKPGAGHMPPYLAGRREEEAEFRKLLKQTTILKNPLLTGLRGVGKTVLMNHFKPIAFEMQWLWVGTDLSEAASITEENVATRIIADVSTVTSNIPYQPIEEKKIGFLASDNKATKTRYLDFQTLSSIYGSVPGLVADKLKVVLQHIWEVLIPYKRSGIVFAYDEAQTMSDHDNKGQYPLALLLDVFQSIQSKGIPFMLCLAGLPTLFPKLVNSRTYAERMFRVITLDKLNEKDSRDAILEPVRTASCPCFNDLSVKVIIKESDGYPYFIQFLCRESYDAILQRRQLGEEDGVPISEIIRKLDDDFFSGRWARATDRQRELLSVIANLQNSGNEFSVLEIIGKAEEFNIRRFGSSHVNQMLTSLADAGLIYKNRHGRYSYAVPLLDRFIRRQNVIAKKL